MNRTTTSLRSTCLLLACPLLLAGCPDREEGERPRLFGLGAEPDPPPVDTLLAEGRHWQAAHALDVYLARVSDPEAGLLLDAGRANVGWGGWERTVELLGDLPWLDEERAGLGWYYLGRGYDGLDMPAEAAAAYARFLEIGEEAHPLEARVARLRQGLAEVRTGDPDAGREKVRAVAGALDGLGRWTPLLVGGAFAERGDTAGVREMVAGYGSGAAGLHGRRLRLEAARRAGDRTAARALAREFRAWAGTSATQGEFLYEGSLAALAMGDSAAAVGGFRGVIDLAALSAAGLNAARRLEQLSDTPRDRLLIASVYQRHGLLDRAIELYEWYLESGAGDRASQDQARLDLTRTFIMDGREPDALESVAPVLQRGGAPGRRAWQLYAQAHSRTGNVEEGREAYREMRRRFPDTRESAVFWEADLAHESGDLDAAREGYGFVIRTYRGRDLAGLAAMRVGGLEFFEGNFQRAVEAWEGYRRSFPRGGRWLEATYWAGRAYEEMGNEAQARSMFEAVRGRDRMSYYALKASERLGQPFWPVPIRSRGLPDAAERERAEARMAVLDFLQAAGFAEAADAEADRLTAAAPSGSVARAAHAEALAERGYARWGIQVGTTMEAREGRTERALRLQYPFPFRAIIAAEARERDLDPFVAAALIRQESLFQMRITSPVGARGLMQVMPRTGRAVADDLGIEAWDDDLLYDPEVNVHIGVAYLAEQMEAFDGSLPSVFGAYNAGPHRVERWMDYPEYGRDEELFTERIPFRETRDYVKILTRNLAVYRGLYEEEENTEE